MWDWTQTIVRPSKLPLVAQRKKAGLDAGLGLFAVKKIESMQLVAILSDGPVYEDRQDPAIKDKTSKEVVLVRANAVTFTALYQGRGSGQQRSRSGGQKQLRGVDGEFVRRGIGGQLRVHVPVCWRE